ncbi:jg22297 [Pararge aegeria aegeria]|uniref:Jg22297 protein n=1 Tax=Pararge aegeria aegeria TaxID=348720 RepID=A0A8S4SNA4_9NEOP|nr:jg22297 [Pararge aegeria aegeria]
MKVLCAFLIVAVAACAAAPGSIDDNRIELFSGVAIEKDSTGDEKIKVNFEPGELKEAARTFEEARGKIKKYAPLLAGIGVKVVAVIGLLFGALTLMVTKALVVAKLAFLAATALGVHKYLGGEGFGSISKLDRNSFEKEIDRRIQLGWGAFGKLRRVFSSPIPQCLKTKVFDQCVLPVMTYGAETWTLTARLIHKLQVAQRAMERAMLGPLLRRPQRVVANGICGAYTTVAFAAAYVLVKLPRGSWKRDAPRYSRGLGKRGKTVSRRLQPGAADGCKVKVSLADILSMANEPEKPFFGSWASGRDTGDDRLRLLWTLPELSREKGTDTVVP